MMCNSEKHDLRIHQLLGGYSTYNLPVNSSPNPGQYPNVYRIQIRNFLLIN